MLAIHAGHVDVAGVKTTSTLRPRQLLALAAAGWAGTAWAGPGPATRAASANLTGVWTNAWYTRLERPKDFKLLAATPAEAEAFEAPRRAHRGELIVAQDEVGQAESEFPDNGPGLARIDGQIRTSWIVNPADGQIPWTKDGRARFKAFEGERYDHVEQRPTDERCLTVPGAAAPMLNSHDANLLQIVQTADWLLIVGEKNHETRIVRLRAPHPGETPPPLGWNGASVGRWEGATLAVETRGLRPGLTKISDELVLSDQARVTERFTRTGPAEIRYVFEVADPTLFTQVWTGEMVFRTAEGQLYEYACHEGNYSLPSILSAARQGRQPPAEPPPGNAR